MQTYLFAADKQEAVRTSYPSRLLSAILRLWNAQETLRLKNIRRSHLPYFFAFPLAMIFANMQEVLFKSDYSLFGLDAVTLMAGSYCLGAGVLFIFSNQRNLSAIARLSAVIASVGFLFWLLLPDSAASLSFAMLFMAGIGGCAASGGYSYAFVLNNTERFWGIVLISFFYALARINAGLPLLSPTGLRIFMVLLVAGVVVSLAAYRAKDFEHVQKRQEKGLGPAVWLMLYFFMAMYFIDMFFIYLPGTAEPDAMILCGAFGLAAVLLCVLLQILLSCSVWVMCNLFFIALVGSYALMYAPAGSALRMAAISLHGLQLIGYLAGIYLLGCVLNRFGDFRLFKLIVAVIMPVSVLMYLVPDLLAGMPSVLHGTAMASSATLFIIFLLLSPAYSSYLFSADWSDDLRRLTMSEAQKRVEQADRFDSLNLTPREKEIAALLLQGLTIKQIAVSLDIAFDTAKYHIRNLYKKLGIGSRPELFARFTVSINNNGEKSSIPQ